MVRPTGAMAMRGRAGAGPQVRRQPRRLRRPPRPGIAAGRVTMRSRGKLPPRVERLRLTGVARISHPSAGRRARANQQARTRGLEKSRPPKAGPNRRRMRLLRRPRRAAGKKAASVLTRYQPLRPHRSHPRRARASPKALSPNRPNLKRPNRRPTDGRNLGRASPFRRDCCFSRYCRKTITSQMDRARFKPEASGSNLAPELSGGG